MTKRLYDAKKVSERLIELRKEKGLTQSQLAEKLNWSRSQVSLYECANRIPSELNLMILADFFNVDIDYILGKTEYKTIYDQLWKQAEKWDENHPELKKTVESIEVFIRLCYLLDCDLQKLDLLAPYEQPKCDELMNYIFDCVRSKYNELLERDDK